MKVSLAVLYSLAPGKPNQRGTLAWSLRPPRKGLGHHLPLGQGQLLQAGTLSVLFLAGPKSAWCLVHTEGTS